ncbi:MAG: hypothetical protein JOZ60_06045 [Verrucomicrobia bacterium]|nr:hypothetical protein [Verrucomicrobiota bacterium]
MNQRILDKSITGSIALAFQLAGAFYLLRRTDFTGTERKVSDAGFYFGEVGSAVRDRSIEQTLIRERSEPVTN